MRKPLALCFSLLVLCAALTGCTLHQGSASAASETTLHAVHPSDMRTERTQPLRKNSGTTAILSWVKVLATSRL